VYEERVVQFLLTQRDGRDGFADTRHIAKLELRQKQSARHKEKGKSLKVCKLVSPFITSEIKMDPAKTSLPTENTFSGRH